MLKVQPARDARKRGQRTQGQLAMSKAIISLLFAAKCCVRFAALVSSMPPTLYPLLQSLSAIPLKSSGLTIQSRIVSSAELLFLLSSPFDCCFLFTMLENRPRTNTNAAVSKMALSSWATNATTFVDLTDEDYTAMVGFQASGFLPADHKVAEEFSINEVSMVKEDFNSILKTLFYAPGGPVPLAIRFCRFTRTSCGSVLAVMEHAAP